MGNRGIEGIDNFVLLLYLGNHFGLSQIGNLKHVAVFAFEENVLNSHSHATGLFLLVFDLSRLIFRLNFIHGAILDVRHNDLLLVLKEFTRICENLFQGEACLGIWRFI